jgi:hypothetical protein
MGRYCRRRFRHGRRTRSTNSYYDLRVADWKKLFAAAQPALLGAKTDAAWASAAAAALEPTHDIHMHLRLGERTFGVGRRAVDPLFRRELLDR